MFCEYPNDDELSLAYILTNKYKVLINFYLLIIRNIIYKDPSLNKKKPPNYHKLHMDNPYWQKDLIWDFDDFNDNVMFITNDKNDAVGIYANPIFNNQKLTF